MNAAIRAVVRTGIYHGIEMYGVERGLSGLCSGAVMKSFTLGSVAGIIPVSYTHLDVYKRQEGSIVDIGSELEVIARSGSWYSYKGERIGQGRENAKMFLMQNPKILDEIENDIKQIYKTKKTSASQDDSKI